MRSEGISSDKRPLAQRNLQDSYLYFLSLCNGGYAKDGFFHFFGTVGPTRHELVAWNQPDSWKAHFGLDDQWFVFAEDIFGTQFFFDVRGTRRAVKMLIPDNGSVSLCANSFEDFVEDEIFGEDAGGRARHLARQFFQEKGLMFRPFAHIACKIPILLGGKQVLENLEFEDSLTNLSILGQVYGQVKDLPPGTPIENIHIDRRRMP
jgi:hypothetical protein